MTETFRHVALDDVGSTNDEARERLLDLINGPYVVTARRQLSGRGRRGRTWASPAGNLYASFALQSAMPVARLPELSFVAALSVCEMVRTLTGAAETIRCKWPNDVLADDAKLCGILLETAGLPSGDMAVIIGIGVNVTSCPVDTPYPSRCLSDLGFGGPLDRVRAELSGQIAHWHSKWEVNGFEPVREAWLARASGLGQPLVARLSDREIEGRFAGLAEDGALMLETGAGDVLRIAAADVFRPGMIQQGTADASRD